MAERIVGELIKSSSNYKVLFENVQLIQDKTTIGELDFIIEEKATKKVLHIELAYKFYLFDPSISANTINNWIGPNRNDSLVEKLGKLKRKQFPLLYHPKAQLAFNKIEIDNISQALCLLASLYTPYEYKESFNPSYAKAIKGYYFGFDTFKGLDNSSKSYHIPSKKEWGMAPSDNESWTNFISVEKAILASMQEKQAPLIWQKKGNEYEAFFVVWWN